jgi:alkanesulfonate monooxygenase SsuD/methylene tetrahydromethanopterin reductase-like flavin-dependent oxidoreductase (luciferase family)
MKLGVHVGYWGLGMRAREQLQVVQEAEHLGYDSVWVAEAYGSDAATVLAWLAAGTSKIKQRYGFEDAATEIQDLYLEGKKEQAAAAAIPDQLIDMVSLCGPRSVVADRIAAFRDAGVGTLTITPLAFGADDRIAQLRAIAELAT